METSRNWPFPPLTPLPTSFVFSWGWCVRWWPFQRVTHFFWVSPIYTGVIHVIKHWFSPVNVFYYRGVSVKNPRRVEWKFFFLLYTGEESLAENPLAKGWRWRQRREFVSHSLMLWSQKDAEANISWLKTLGISSKGSEKAHHAVAQGPPGSRGLWSESLTAVRTHWVLP